MNCNDSDSTPFVPAGLVEAIEYFSDPDACFETMVALRWPNGVECPHCTREGVVCKDVHFIESRKIWRCKGCKKQFSVKVGSVMEDSPLSLKIWLSAIWLIANTKNGTSSCELARHLKIRQATAWFVFHRIREAMSTGTFEKMSGTVEADETFIGGKAKNMQGERKASGRGTSGKAVVMGLLERPSEKPSKVRVKHVKDTTRATLHKEIAANVEHGSEVFTDALPSYENMDSRYIHQAVDHATTYVVGAVHTNGLENFWCLLKRTICGTYVSVNAPHLFRYLDEQAFRFNERKDNDAGRFMKVAGSLAGKRLTYKELTGKND